MISGARRMPVQPPLPTVASRAWSRPRTASRSAGSSSTRKPQPWENPADGARIAWSSSRSHHLRRHRPVRVVVAHHPPAADDLGELHARLAGPDAPGTPRQVSPGSSVIRSRPERNASGGQVIGSIATERRCRSPCSVSPVNTCHQPNAASAQTATPAAVRRGQRHRASRRRRRGSTSPNAVSSTRADPPGLGEVVLAAGHPGRADRQQPAVDQQPAAGRHLQHQVVDGDAGHPQVRVRGEAERRRRRADVGRLVRRPAARPAPTAPAWCAARSGHG